jgi:CHAT domain-containing protein/tetratricopeptide (TPR) repeat protein
MVELSAATMRCFVRLSVCLGMGAALSAQNVNIPAYPQYKAELEAYQEAFNGKASDRGESLARAGVDAARAAGDRSGEAHWTRLTGATFQVRGNLARAREYYGKSLELRRELKQQPDMLVLTTGLGFTCYTLRDYDAARRYLGEATALAAELKQPPDEGRAWYLLGLVERAQQRFDEAEAALGKSLAKYGEAGPAGRAFIGLDRIELARVHIDRTRYPAALREGLEAVRVLSALPRREADTAAALDVAGTAFHFLEDPRKALEYYRQAFELRTKAKVDPTESYRNIGVELDQLGSHQEAIEYLEKVVTARRRGGPQTELAGALINLAVAQENSGRPAEARRNFNEALELLPDERAAFRQRAIVLYGLGNLDIAGNKIDDALARHREALRLRRELGDARGALRGLNRVGIALEKARKWQEALAVHEEATTAFEALLAGISDPVQAVAFRATSAILYPHRARVLVELGRPRDALLTAERGRGTGLNRIAAMGAQSQGSALNEATARAAAARNRLRAALESSRERQAEEIGYLEASRELSRLRDELASAGKASVKAADSPSFDKILAMTRREPMTLFLEWVGVDEDLTLLFAVSARHGLETFRIPKSLGAMGALLDDWYRSLSRGQSARGMKVLDNPATTGESEEVLAARVYSAIFGEAAARLDGFSRLVLVTDGALLRTPFPALVDPKGRRLVDRFSIATAMSLASLLTPPVTKAGSPRVYAIGDPIGEGNSAMVAPQGVRFAPLAGAREEAATVASLWPGSVSVSGGEVRESEVKKKLPGYDIVHFATHGILDLNEPLRSSLLLASEPDGSGEDGLLEAWEIASLRLHTRLAVLSACETGQGRETLSDGILGLSWAFQAAGCPDVVASLWSVDDSATRALMIAFYEQIRGGARIDDALRTAMQKVRGEKARQSPYYWAAFQIIGPTDPLVKRRPR